MTDRLSLHQLAGNGATPSELLDIAARLGCPAVTVFANASARSGAAHVASAAEARALRRQADALGVRICSLEVFVLGADTDIAAFEPALEVGEILGGERMTVTVDDPDLARARGRFDALCERAAAHGLKVHVEFHAFGSLRSLAATEAFLADPPPTASISADVLHFYRNEGGLAALAGPRTVPIGHAQLCDGPLCRPREEWLFEAVADRLVPGAGEFDLVAFLRALPDDIRIDVEVPTQPERMDGASGPARCETALSAARAVLAAAWPSGRAV
jgi:sugar phosphate isomerase/epimerase